MAWKKLIKIRGEDGKTPVAGVDFKIPEDGKSPIPGVDFEIPKNGKDADNELIIKRVLAEINIPEINEEEIISKVISKLPKFENGKDGKNGSSDDGYAIIKKIRELKDEGVDWNDIKNKPNFYQPAIGGMSNTTVLQNLNSLPENLSAQCNGSNTVFTVLNPILAIVFLSLNGQVQIEGKDFDKTGDKQITLLTSTPQGGEELYIKYVQV